MSSSKSVLSVGLFATGPVQQQLDDCVSKAKAAGIDLDMNQFKIAEFDQFLPEVEVKLKSKDWAGYIVGWGVRAYAQNTEMFEKLVNLGSQTRPGIRFGFNDAPDTLHEAALRIVEGK